MRKFCVVLALVIGMFLAGEQRGFSQVVIDGVPVSAIDGVPIAPGMKFDGVDLMPAGISIETSCKDSVTSSGTVACTVSGLTGGETIVAMVADRDNVGSSVTDGNGDTFTLINYLDDVSDPGTAGMYYAKNVGSGSATVQYNLSTSSSWAFIYVLVLKGASTTAPLDSTFSSSFGQASTSGTVANANCGTARTPSNANSLVLGFVTYDNTTSPSAGTNYTLLTNTFGTASFPEYWNQTTATSTNAPFVNPADDWVEVCAAFHS